jgi:ABC-type antimicrobial peptide transport system permease subunit
VFGDVPDIKLGRSVINALAFEPGSFGPTIISGRRPQGPDEIALGARAVRHFHTRIGQMITITPLDPSDDQPVGPPVPLRIVGTTITPDFFFTQVSGGYNAAVSEDFPRKYAPKGTDLHTSAFVRFAPGVSVEDGVERINAAAPGGSAFVTRRAESSDLTNLERISSLPNVLAGLLALVAAGTLAHTLLSSVRRRRRDVAVLRALGFVRGQVRMTIVWQATTIILLSVAIGLPIGAVAGRWGWRVFVDQLGYFPLPIVPMVSVLLTIPIAIALANIIASIPARAAARVQPAVALRAE